MPALKGVDFYEHLEVIYWLHRSPRNLVLQSPKKNGKTRGTFSLRSPVRPNPIGTSIVKFVGIEGSSVLVRGLDCLDETPLIDLKPDRCEFLAAGGAAGEDGGLRERPAQTLLRFALSESSSRYRCQAQGFSKLGL